MNISSSHDSNLQGEVEIDPQLVVDDKFSVKILSYEDNTLGTTATAVKDYYITAQTVNIS
ncbi:4138_t:CDS:2 [Dentiscutata erythropus]|uniref:4138_t:CDS:1 n=1 Tax=Dentiscutata erythropus TaxID=1348616 RepID=A0A9N9HUE5_9GLOM|nr:4138_t:CDS:2 [Dentiscutata erythropus]